MINVVEEVAEGRTEVNWSTVTSTASGKELTICVFADSMKFNGVPALTWGLRPLGKDDTWYTEEVLDGVRLPATALQLQRIADLTGCMLLTPKVIDLIWVQAVYRFNAVTTACRAPGGSDRVIVANSPIHAVHRAVEAALGAAQGTRKLVSSEGKYWCLTNGLLGKASDTACNYGWMSANAPYGGVTAGVKVWQTPGYRHNHDHLDPSQTIRLMYREAVLADQKTGRTEVVDLMDLAQGPLAGLIHHEPGPLQYLRQAAEPQGNAVLPMYAPKLGKNRA